MFRSPKRLMVFQHHPAEHLGRFAPMLDADGISLHMVRLDRGDPIPDLAAFDGLWALGGPMQVWEEDCHPWLAKEKAAIREAVMGQGMPYFGLCLGHQLLADALGGEVGPCAEPEVGILPVDLNETGAESPFLAGLPRSFTCTQGHGAEVKAPPSCATVLASSPLCAIQALQVGDAAVSLQFHCELTVDMIEACLELPEYKADFEAVMGAEGIAEFIARSAESASAFERDAALLYDNWMRAVFPGAIGRGATSG